MLKRSIISCSLLVLTGAGGSGSANALLFEAIADVGEVTTSLFPIGVPELAG